VSAVSSAFAMNTVVIFKVNQMTGKLTPANQIVKVAIPCTIVFR
jgi:6-phosphogluconolactonase (cycloisomerase 2 family)